MVSSLIDILICIALFVSVFSFFSLAPWVPTGRGEFKRIEKILNLKPWEKFLELWCGTGGILLFLARKHSDVKFVGIELSLPLFFIVKIRASLSGLKNVTILFWDALRQDLTQYDALYVYGLPETLTKKLFPLLNTIKNKNFRLISYCFRMDNTYFRELQHRPIDKNSVWEYRV